MCKLEKKLAHFLHFCKSVLQWKKGQKRNERNGKKKGKHTGRKSGKADYRAIQSEKRSRYAKRIEGHFRTDV